MAIKCFIFHIINRVLASAKGIVLILEPATFPGQGSQRLSGLLGLLMHILPVSTRKQTIGRGAVTGH